MADLVTVLICTHNAEIFIESTIQSILLQTFKNFEVIILDNASTDNTVHLLEKMQKEDKRITIIASKTNLGAYGGLNYLIEKAKGTYIAINDHDDIWYSHKLEKQVAFLESNPKYIGCGSAIINWYQTYQKFFYRSQPVAATIAWHSSLLFRNEGYKYDLSVRIATDFYFMKNILCRNKKILYNFSEPFVLRRIFRGNKNMSGQWMKRASIYEILRLKIAIFDKLAMVSRVLLPQELVEWALVMLFAGNIPKQYQNYFDVDSIGGK